MCGNYDTADSDLLPIPRGTSQDDSDEDLSPVRKRRDGSDDDLSPVRTTKLTNDRHNKSGEPTRKRTESKPEVLSTGKAGLKTGAELREENRHKRNREKDMLKGLNADVTGKDADTVRRDKSGRRINEKLENIKRRKDEEEKLKKEEKYAKWGKGL